MRFFDRCSILAVEHLRPSLGTNVLLHNLWRKRGADRGCWASDDDDDMSSGHSDKLEFGT